MKTLYAYNPKPRKWYEDMTPSSVLGLTVAAGFSFLLAVLVALTVLFDCIGWYLGAEAPDYNIVDRLMKAGFWVYFGLIHLSLRWFVRNFDTKGGD